MDLKLIDYQVRVRERTDDDDPWPDVPQEHRQVLHGSRAALDLVGESGDLARFYQATLMSGKPMDQGRVSMAAVHLGAALSRIAIIANHLDIHLTTVAQLDLEKLRLAQLQRQEERVQEGEGSAVHDQVSDH